ncbi:MAG: hypothetical protein LZ166_02840, partial [Thaumarchaeota archaeon]|nr:hypothetical protein [Candidatus Wolframiiraptor allenii]
PALISWGTRLKVEKDYHDDVEMPESRLNIEFDPHYGDGGGLGADTHDTFQGMGTMSGISSSGAYARAIGA